MTPLQRLLLVAALPMGLVFAGFYFIRDVRDAVSEYLPGAFLPPVGLLQFFAFGACVGMFAALLVMPGSLLNDRQTRSDLQEAFGISGPGSVRLMSLFILLLCGIAMAIIVDKAYG